MKKFIIPVLALSFTLLACEKKQQTTAENPSDAAITTAPLLEEKPAPLEIQNSVLRISSTSQEWNVGRPWEKRSPRQISALGVVVGENLVLTSAELVADATYLELQTPDASRTAEAKIVARDYEANLALLTVKDDAKVEEFFEGTNSLKIANPPKIGDPVDIVQVENNGTTLLSTGRLQSIEVTSSLLPGHNFLTYLVKASLQSAPNSYSLPAIVDGKLLGILLSYDSDDQISDIMSVEIISRFIAEAKDGEYSGFPKLGVSASRTDDPSFREFLKIDKLDGGLFVSTVRKGGAADQAGVKVGDVLFAIDGSEIDSRGYYQHPDYGTVSWANLVRGGKAAGDQIELSIVREGEPITIQAELKRTEAADDLIPAYQYDRAPNFLVKGGLIFQELSRPLLEAYGKDWESRAPLNLLDAYENPEKYQENRRRLVFLSATIPTPATVGYEALRNYIVKNVNGTPIVDIQSLIEAFKKPNAEGLHSIQFIKEDFTVYLDEATSSAVDRALMQRGFNSLSRAE